MPELRKATTSGVTQHSCGLFGVTQHSCATDGKRQKDMRYALWMLLILIAAKEEVRANLFSKEITIKVQRSKKMKLVVFCSLAITLSCNQIPHSAIAIDQFISQKTEKRDSLFAIYTLKCWGEKQWDRWAVRSDVYKITASQIRYFVSESFYSNDKKKYFFG